MLYSAYEPGNPRPGFRADAGGTLRVAFMEPQKTRVLEASRALEHEIVDLSLRIHANPELGHQEHRAVAWCRETLAGHGFDFDIVPGIDTAFVATLRGGRGGGRVDGPTIGFLAEYDALPGVDHG